jgi:hypothetical protein
MTTTSTHNENWTNSLNQKQTLLAIEHNSIGVHGEASIHLKDWNCKKFH